MPRFQICVITTEVRKVWLEVDAPDEEEAQEAYHEGSAEETFSKHLETTSTDIVSIVEVSKNDDQATTNFIGQFRD